MLTRINNLDKQGAPYNVYALYAEPIYEINIASGALIPKLEKLDAATLVHVGYTSRVRASTALRSASVRPSALGRFVLAAKAAAASEGVTLSHYIYIRSQPLGGARTAEAAKFLIAYIKKAESYAWQEKEDKVFKS